MMMHVERLIDVCEEWRTAKNDLRSAKAAFDKKYGEGRIIWENGSNDDERRIVYRIEIEDKTYHNLWAVCYVLGMTDEEQEKLHLATRAVWKWMEKNDWMKCPDHRLYAKLEKYIFGEGR